MNQMFFGNAKIILFNPGSSPAPGPAGHAETWIKFSENDTWHEYDIEGAMDCPALVAAGLMPEGSGDEFEPYWTNQPYAVEIGSNVTSIGYQAFYGCSGLTSVVIPDSVTSIDYEAFSGCSRLTSITIGNGVTYIGVDAFSGCNASLFDTTTISSVKLVDGWAIDTTGQLNGSLDLTGARGIGTSAFSGCRGLTSVTIPDSVTSIGGSAFYGCIRLTSIIIGNGVTSIGQDAFEDCLDLTSVMFLGKTMQQVQNIEDGYGNKWYSWGLDESVIIPGIVEDVVLYTTAANPSTWLESTPEFDANTGTFSGFAEKKDAIKVIIPSKVNGKEVIELAESIFSFCENLTNVVIPASIKFVGIDLFQNSSIVSILVMPENTNFKSVNGMLLSKDGTTLFEGVNGNTVTIPNGVITIRDDAFNRRRSINNIIISNSVKTIGNTAFEQSGLITMTIPNTVENFGYDIWRQCEYLTTVTIIDNGGDTQTFIEKLINAGIDENIIHTA